MECKKDDMTEVIADARAEEEVMKEQLRKKMQEVTEKAKADIKERLGAVKPMVTITMDEYGELKDAMRVIDLLWKKTRLSYDKEDLRVDADSEIVTALKIFYPEKYEAIFNDLLTKTDKED